MAILTANLALTTKLSGRGRVLSCATYVSNLQRTVK